MNRQQLNKIHQLDCGEIAIRISQYSIYLKKQENSLRSKINWINDYTRMSICDRVGNYTGRWENQDKMAIKDDDTLSKLDLIKMKLAKQYDEINGLTFVINNLAEQFRNLGYVKKREGESNG